MTEAVTPNARSHAALKPMASRFVDVDDLPWEATPYDGISSRTLLFEKASGLLTALIRMAPGSELPDHTHMQIEQTWVLDGHLVCGEGECTAGNFVWRPAGSRHRAWSPDGALLLGMFLVPNKFHSAEGETDMLGQDWTPTWADCINMRA
ncbi:MAG: cupin domain-containing protein [Minwuia sp.]|uniref:cupin domain-containing protein n=1 Tax=Minwuia sp. TaxID=2493630 RepID=UPI003A8BE042